MINSPLFRRLALVVGLSLLLFALIAPAVPARAYYRIPTISGAFWPPVHQEYLSRGCIVHVVNEQGHYYVECPYTDHPLFSWSPILAVVGVAVLSPVFAGQEKRVSWPFRFVWILEILAGFEGMWIAFISLSGRLELRTYIGLLGWPIGFTLFLDGLRRNRVPKWAIVLAGLLVFLVSGWLYVMMALVAGMLSEY